MEKISLLLIRALSEQDGFMTTKEIAAKVGVSTKTVRRYVEKINQSQSLYGCVIQGKKGSGLFLQIINHELFQRSLENTPQEDFVTKSLSTSSKKTNTSSQNYYVNAYLSHKASYLKNSKNCDGF